MIRNPNEIKEGAKKIRMLIAGYPGIGKSTLALSAPNPLHIDVDFGIDRIEPRYRKPYIQPRSYDEILEDLTPDNLQDFDTLVFDTGGKLISLMSLWAIKKDPKYGQRDGSLSLKGYGFVRRTNPMKKQTTNQEVTPVVTDAALLELEGVSADTLSNLSNNKGEEDD